MSWMDSWSRPSKSQATPPPLYLTSPETPYCHSCGRTIGQRKKQVQNEVKYCSARCRNNKPRQIDRRIESVFTALLDGASLESLNADKEKEGEAQSENGAVYKADNKTKNRGRIKPVKGDPRILVDWTTVEEIIFPRPKDPTKTFGRKKNRAARSLTGEQGEWMSVDMVDTPLLSVEGANSKTPRSDVGGEHTVAGRTPENDVHKNMYRFGSSRVRPPQAKSDINGSVGGEKGWAERILETPEMLVRRREGERRAEEKEMVKRAARRGVAFGFGDGKNTRKCEAVMNGVVVESSFAKGEWSIRWRQ